MSTWRCCRRLPATNSPSCCSCQGSNEMQKRFLLFTVLSCMGAAVKVMMSCSGSKHQRGQTKIFTDVCSPDMGTRNSICQLQLFLAGTGSKACASFSACYAFSNNVHLVLPSPPDLCMQDVGRAILEK